MKTRLFVLMALMISTVFTANAQSKKDCEQNLVAATQANDSLQKAYKNLIAVYDSINTVCINYDTMYSVIKTRVILRDFNPLEMSTLIDSLRTIRETEFSHQSGLLTDSIASLNVELANYKASVDSVAGQSAKEAEIVASLKQLKELLDSKIITQEEFNAKKIKAMEAW